MFRKIVANIIRPWRVPAGDPIILKDNPRFNRYQIGAYSYGRPTVLHWGESVTLKIGKFCSIAEGVCILVGGEHRTDWVSTFPFAEFFGELRPISGHPRSKGDVIIGDDVWIGKNALILSGITLGSGCVIAAGSVVTKSVSPYAIVGGNPAKLIRSRFPTEIVDALLRISWWDWPIEQILPVVTLLQSNRLNEFIGKFDSPREEKQL